MKVNRVCNEKRQTTEYNIHVGDQVLAKDMCRNNKTCTTFEQVPYTVISKDGNAVTIKRADGVQRMRKVAHLEKFLPGIAIGDSLHTDLHFEDPPSPPIVPPSVTSQPFTDIPLVPSEPYIQRS